MGYFCELNQMNRYFKCFQYIAIFLMEEYQNSDGRKLMFLSLCPAKHDTPALNWVTQLGWEQWKPDVTKSAC